MAINGSGIRDTARVLRVSPATAIQELKKEKKLENVNHKALEALNSKSVIVELRRAEDEAKPRKVGKQKLMKCKALLEGKRTNVGCGMPSTTTTGRY